MASFLSVEAILDHGSWYVNRIIPELRHNGEDEGRGVVGWRPIVAARFRKKEPAVQAFDMVIEHSGFTENEAESIRSKFSLTTLRRFMESKDVRAELGLSVENGQLCTNLPGNEVIKPLKKIVLDIAGKQIDSRKYNKAEKMVEYIRRMSKADKPDLSKRRAESRPIEGIQKTEFSATKRSTTLRRSSATAERKHVVPKSCSVNVTDNRIGAIYRELKILDLDKTPNAIAVLLRVFLELSVDHFLDNNGGATTFKMPNGKTKDKGLQKKLTEVVEMLVAGNVPERRFASIKRALGVKTSPMNVDLLHMYVHDGIATPSRSELVAGWDHAQPLFESIWL